MSVMLLTALTLVVICKLTAAACPVTSPPATIDEQMTIINLHNTLRQRVASGQATGLNGVKITPATNMQNLTWNADLASAAQNQTNRCSFKPERPTVAAFNSVGQNLYQQFSSQEFTVCSFKSAINSWYNGSLAYENSQRQPFKFTQDTGAFTQVIWAQTTSIGCGCSNFMDKENAPFKQIIVCNYGPAGNIQTGELYKIA